MMLNLCRLRLFNQVIAFVLMSFPQVQATVYDTFLKNVENAFDSTSNLTEKFNLVSQPVNKNYLDLCQGQEEFSSLDPEKLREDGTEAPNSLKTTPIALAVSLGKVALFRKFLTVVPNVNNYTLAAWGFRQPYTLAHLALDPQYPITYNVSLNDRLAIIDMLGENKADFNATVSPMQKLEENGIYTNPPLTSGLCSGRMLLDAERLQAQALLYGADPTVKGSSFYGLNLNEEILDLVFSQYLIKVLHNKTEALRPSPQIKKAIDGRLARVAQISKLTNPHNQNVTGS